MLVKQTEEQKGDFRVKNIFSGKALLGVKELLEADEILLTTAVRGIQWVREYEGKVYGNKKAVELTAFLNQELSLAD